MLASLIAIIGSIVGYLSKDFLWFARFGSIIIWVGILFLARTAFTGDLLPHIKMADSPFYSNQIEHYKYVKKKIPPIIQIDIKARKAVNIYGPLVTFMGTIIWGFGDLLNCIFHFKC